MPNCDDNDILSGLGVSKHIQGKTVLDGISFSVPEGKIIGLLGPAGEAKSLLMKIIAGIAFADRGEIVVDGVCEANERKSKAAYLPEKSALPEYLTVYEIIDFYADFFEDFDKERAYALIDALQIFGSERIKKLSRATREKLQLILVMSRRAKLYLLDEPIGRVDPAARDFIIDTVLKNYDRCASVIISTNLISDVEKILDEFFFISNGKILLSSTPKDIKEKYGKTVDLYFREVFRC